MKEEHNLKLTKLKEEYEKSRQESDLKLKNEIESLRNQISEVVEMVRLLLSFVCNYKQLLFTFLLIVIILNTLS